MKTTIDLQNLIEAAYKQQADDHTKRAKALHDFCQEANIYEVARIRVQATKTPIKTPNGEIYHEYSAEDEQIIRAINLSGEAKTENIYFFNKGRYLFVTDNHDIYNLTQTARPLYPEEKQKIKQIKQTLQDQIKEINEGIQRVKIARLLLKNEADLTEAEKNIINSSEALLIKIQAAQSNNISWSLNRLASDYEMNNLLKTLTDLKQTAADKIKEIYFKAASEPHFYIRHLKQNNQIKIYISKQYKRDYQNLGYTIYTNNAPKIINEFNQELLEFQPVEVQNKSYYFQLNTRAFISFCIHGTIAHKGYFINQDGERELLPPAGRPCEAVTVIDYNGEELHFNSKSDFAKQFNISEATVTKLIKSSTDGVIKMNYKVKLIDDQGNILGGSSWADLGNKLGVSRLVMSRATKNKTLGDEVNINGLRYRIG